MYYQVIHHRIARQINTGYKLYAQEWDNSTSEVVVPRNTKEERFRYLTSLRSRMEKDASRLRGILVRLDRFGASYTAEEVVELYNTPPENGVLAYTRRLIASLEVADKQRTAETYTTVLNSFRRFLGDRDVYLGDMDSGLMMEYEGFLKTAGVCQNTISFYMRNLRAIYNRAVEEELTAQRNPFKHVYTGIGKTAKRAVTLKVVRQVRDLKLTDPLMDYARDMFLFSFYTRGMSFIDMAYLKKSDLKNGILSYRRQKTHQHLTVKWERPMQKIVDKYDTKGTPYLLPIIRRDEVDERRQYKSALHLINNKLKMIGDLLKLEMPLTTYVARHGWASVAKSKNISVSVISEAMGHDSESTTRIYLASLDASVVDKANSLILKSL